MANTLASGIVPAQLGFLAIYNPGLGTTDDTLHDQIVYYASATTQSGPKRRRHRAAKDGRPTDAISREERNERLRQIGLAQGMVEFAKSFSEGKAVDSIDTEHSRVVLHELEPGWWILASVDLTRLPLPPTKSAPGSASAGSTSAPSPPPAKGTPGTPIQSQPPTPAFEYSSREVKPAILLLQDLLRAHSLFLLHHGPSLSTLFASAARSEFTTLLARYWDLFLSTWNVLLHGNPARSVFGGINIAACGELGIGVGEEERGSGEREVLEGLVDRVEGLVDLVVGRFGREEQVEVGKGKGKSAAREEEGWLGLGNEVGDEEGAVFLGVGALSRRSLRAVTGWMEDVYTWGESAYGVVDSSAGAGSRTKRRRPAGKKPGPSTSSPTDDGKKEQVKGKSNATEPQTGGGSQGQHQNAQPDSTAKVVSAEAEAAGGGMDKMFSYLKLGYGTYWSLGTSSPAADSNADNDPTIQEAKSAESVADRQRLNAHRDGCFLLGLGEQPSGPEQPDSPNHTASPKPRTVTVELEAQTGEGRAPDMVSPPRTDSNARGHPKRTTAELHPVVYVQRPFIYILLFHPPSTTTSPPWEPLSHSLETQLKPLHKPLLTSTAYRPEKPSLGGGGGGGAGEGRGTPSEIYDLVFDPQTLTLHSTIPNIPDPVLLADSTPGVLAPPRPQIWTRVEALSTHGQILNTFAGTRADSAALERTCKTSRGWWVVWNRVLDQTAAAASTVPPSQEVVEAEEAEEEEGVSDDPDAAAAGMEEQEAATTAAGDGDGRGGFVAAVGKEIFLVRRASDHSSGGSGGGLGLGAGIRGVSASYVGGGGSGGGGGGAGGGWADGASRLAQGIGVDTRRYVEGLLSLNR